MAYDYNRNGESDLVDACIEYQLVNKHIENSNSSPRSYNSGSDAVGCLGSALGIILVLGVMWLSIEAPWIWILVIFVVAFIVIGSYLSNRLSYNEAKSLFNAKKYAEAAIAFNDLGNRYDSHIYCSICRFIIIYQQTNKLTDYEKKDFDALYNEAQRHYNNIPKLYHTDDLAQLVEYSSVKKINDEAYKKYKDNKYLEKLATEAPYIGMDAKHINNTKYGTYFDVKTISRDTDFNSFIDLKYQKLKSQDIEDYESVDKYSFYDENGDDCDAYVYKDKVCYISYSQVSNIHSKLPYAGLNKMWVGYTKLGKPDLTLTLTPHQNSKEFDIIKRICPRENWNNQSAILYIFMNKAAKTMRKVYVHNEKVINVTAEMPLDEELTFPSK